MSEFFCFDLIVGLVLLLLLLLTTISWLRQERFPEFPGPKGIPILGNALQLGVPKAHLLMAAWAKQYGPVYRLNLLGKPAIVVNGYTEIHEVLVTKGHEFGGRPDTYRLKEATLKNFNFMDPGHEMMFLKKSFMAHLKLHDRTKTTEETTTVLKEHFKALPTDQPLSALNMMQSIILDIMVITVFGDKNAITEEEKNTVLHLIWLFVNVNDQGSSGTMLDIFPFLRFFGNKTAKDLAEFNIGMIKQYDIWRKRMIKDDEEKKKANFLIKMEESLAAGNIDREEAITNVFWMFFGGTCGTIAIMHSLVNILVHHPEIQETLRKEIHEKVGMRDVTFAATETLHYHQAVLLEALRYLTVAPVSFHKTTEQVTLMGKTVPQNTLTWVNTWALHHGESVWGDPFAFRPERFLTIDGCIVPADHPTRENLLPFGAGLRACPGERFTQPRLLILLAAFVREFHFLPETTLDQQVSCDAIEVQESGIALTQPDYKIRLKPTSDKE